MGSHDCYFDLKILKLLIDLEPFLKYIIISSEQINLFLFKFMLQIIFTFLLHVRDSVHEVKDILFITIFLNYVILFVIN